MKSIRRQLMAGLAGGSLVLLLITGGMLWWQTREILVREFDAALRTKAGALISLVKQERGGVELDLADEFLPEFERPKRPEYFQFWLADGKVLERSPSLAGADLPRLAGTLERPALWNLALPNARPGRAIGFQFVPQRDQEDSSNTFEIGPVTVVLARDRIGLDRTLAAFQIRIAAVGVVFLAGIALLTALVVRRGLAPLSRLGDQTAAIDATSLQVRFAPDGMPAELRPIVGRLNDLLARLEEAFQRERRFSADIAHELRTPIAELRALSEVALKWPDDDKTGSFRESLAVAQRMENLVDGLLTLARCEAGKQPVRREPVALAELFEQIWSPLAEPARSKKLTVTHEIAGGLTVPADPALLRLILTNLLANAVEHTPTGGVVRIRAAVAEGEFDFSVANTVDNLCREDLPHLFERFWRKDAARTGNQHAGLGLALAQASAVAQGMNLRAEMPESSLLRITLSSPSPTGEIS
jgi:signal transduction histidine kinase